MIFLILGIVFFIMFFFGCILSTVLQEWALRYFINLPLRGVFFVMVVLFFAWPIIYMASGSEMARIQAVQDSIYEAPMGDSFDEIGYQMKKAEINGMVYNLKFWNRSVFGCMIPDEVEKLRAE